MGLLVLPVRREGLAASRGATDFGEYFLYFSFFLVVSALLLTALFFKLGVEQRLREIGLLQAVGFSPAAIRKLFLTEGILLALLGSLLGLVGALGYGKLMMYGLRTWWVDAVGTTMLSLHVSPVSLAIGAVGGVIAATLCILWTLRRVSHASSRSLVVGRRRLGPAERSEKARSQSNQADFHCVYFWRSGLAISGYCAPYCCGFRPRRKDSRLLWRRHAVARCAALFPIRVAAIAAAESNSGPGFMARAAAWVSEMRLIARDAVSFRSR